MSALTTITLTISFAVIKHMLADWAGDGAKSQIGQDLLDLCRDRLNDWAGSKAERNQIEQMGERMVATMTPLWKSESRTLPENSKEAIVLAVANTLAHGKLDPESIIQHRLDAERMAKSLANEQKSETVGLSRNESALYLQFLIESCRQIIYVANHLNGYVPLMDRLTLLTLEQLLQNTERLIAGPTEQAKEYEAAYLLQLPNQLNKFELIGINYAQDVVNRQKLQRAYVNLRLERSDGSQGYDLLEPNEMDGRVAGGNLRGKPRPSSTINGPIQEILAFSSRLVIRGAPGSGKSTLLRWLAMNITRHELSNGYPAIASWDAAIPFYLRLRSFKHGEIPNPMDWPELNVPKLALNPPDRWMHQLLKDGRAIVLIDGVDEVPGKQRAILLEQLESLVQSYPLARYIITSRPAAIKDWPEWTEWSRNNGFLTVGLQEMELEQSFTFIDHWHDALADSLEKTEDKEKVAALKSPLKQLLRQRLPLRRLARNPLLCTMICALHREHPQNMPHNRVKLYQDCIEMLLYRRDTEREVSLLDFPPTSHTHEEIILRSYAYHLLVTGESEESFDEIDTYFDTLLESVNMPGWSSSKLREFFLKRTGLLIEPADGKISFAHKTFLEYLAAKEIAKKNEISLLLKNARDDQWHETIVLAVSVPEISESQSQRLFKGLLKRADELVTPRNRHELIMLAVACMESPLYLSKELRQQIIEKAAKLIPPKSNDEVARIAKAGDPIVEFLRYNSHFSFRKMARCVDALVAIGSEQALQALIEYARSSSYREENAYSLRQAIGNGLWGFDPADYCRRVLSGLQWLNLRNTQESDARLVHLAGLSGLQTLDLRDTQVSDAGLVYLAGLSGLQTLNLSSTQESDAGLVHLAGLSGLQTLNLSDTQVSDAGLVHLAGLSGLQTLDLSSRQVSDAGLVYLAGLSGLQTLSLSSTQVSDAGLVHLAGLSGLQTLNLSNTKVSDAGLLHLAGLGGLQTINLSNTQVSDAGLVHLAGLSGLQSLNLRNTKVSDAGLVHLAGLSGLQWLNLRKTQVSDAGLLHLAGLSGLQTLDLSFTQVSDAGLVHLAGLSGLQTLNLSFTQVSDAGLVHLAGLSSLQTLNLKDTQVSDAGLVHLAGLSGLQTLNLSNTKVSDAGLLHLAGLSGLQTLDLSFTQVSDAGVVHLAGLSGLQTLDLSDTQVSDAGLVHLAGLSGLQWLNLRNTQVSDAGLLHLAGLSGLQTLNLRDTKVSDAGLVHLVGLSGLQSLALSDTQVKDISMLDHLLGLGIEI